MTKVMINYLGHNLLMNSIEILRFLVYLIRPLVKIPLRSIKSKSVVKALAKFFTLVGLPKVVQSDQGTNFMSNVFQQVMLELGIQKVVISLSS